MRTALFGLFLGVLSSSCGNGTVQILSIKGDRTTAQANGTDVINLTARVTSTTSVPQPGVTVTFSAPTGTTLGGAGGTTDSNGEVKTTATSTKSGTSIVRAHLDDSVTGSSIELIFTTGEGIASKLRFAASPTNTMTTGLLRPIPTVTIEDSSGMLTTSTAAVTVVVTPGSCNGKQLDATSLATVNAVAGTAEFNGLKVTTTGSSCTLTASSGTLTPAVSTAFDIVNP